MDKPALLGIVRRRWYIFVLGFAASVALAYAASLASPPQYTARALVMLLPSKATVGEDGNPFLDLSGLDLPARVVVSSLSSSSVRDQVAAEFPEITYVAGIEESTRGPVIAIDVTGTSRANTLAALPSLIRESTSTLDRLQSEVNAPASSNIRSMLLTEDRSATEDRGGTIRLGIAGAVLGLLATVLSASAIDGWIRHRSPRRAAHQVAEDQPARTATASKAADSVQPRSASASNGRVKTSAQSGRSPRNPRPNSDVARTSRPS